MEGTQGGGSRCHLVPWPLNTHISPSVLSLALTPLSLATRGR